MAFFAIHQWLIRLLKKNIAPWGDYCSYQEREAAFYTLFFFEEGRYYSDRFQHALLNDCSSEDDSSKRWFNSSFLSRLLTSILAMNYLPCWLCQVRLFANFLSSKSSVSLNHWLVRQGINQTRTSTFQSLLRPLWGWVRRRKFIDQAVSHGKNPQSWWLVWLRNIYFQPFVFDWRRNDVVCDSF
jgi:hypothetical protein